MGSQSKALISDRGSYCSILQNVGEDVIDDMMAEFEKLGQKDDFNEVGQGRKLVLSIVNR